MSNSKIAFIFEGPYHVRHIRSVLKMNHREYTVIGDYPDTETMFQNAQAQVKAGAELIISAGGYYDYLVSKMDIPIIPMKRSFATISIVVNKARKVSKHIGFLARKGILYYSAEQYKREFNDPILLETFSNDEELHEKLTALKKHGIDTLIVGSRGSQIAPGYGFRCFTVPFEDLDIMEAVREAEHILKYLEITKHTGHILKMIQNSINEGLLAIDREMHIIEINNYALNMTGKKRSEISGKPLSDTVFSPFGELDSIKENQSSVAELVTIENHMLSATIIPVTDDPKNLFTLITFTSVHQIRSNEKKLQERLKNKGHIAVYSFKDIIGNSVVLANTIERAKSFARVDSSVLITAETGSGKEMFAQSIHNTSRRRDKPFVVVNCAALPENLLESSLFGYEKGAFTGAAKEGRQGSFLTADGGTIFLDEVSEMPLSLQARFLRVLQEKEIVPLGSDEVISVDVRVLAATNRNMREMMSEGKFRSDLYYRLAVLQLKIPSLNERKEDIPDLVRHFLYKRSEDLKLPCPDITEDALQYLQSLDYSGNIRQLQNITERMLVMHKDIGPVTRELAMIATEDMEPDRRAEPARIFNRRNEKEELLYALNACDNNREKTADMLGISKSTLWRRLKKYGII